MNAGSSSTTRILVIRHAESPFDGRLTAEGRYDPPLTWQGVRQAQLLGRRFATDSIDAVICSPMLRALTTASVAAAAIEKTPLIWPGLEEVHMGAAEGSHLADYLSPEDHRAWLKSPSWNAIPGAEDDMIFKQRVLEAFARLVGAGHGDCLAVVTHSAVINALFGHVLSLTGSWFFAPKNTSITEFGVEGQGLSLVGTNDDGHLRDLQRTVRPQLRLP